MSNDHVHNEFCGHLNKLNEYSEIPKLIEYLKTTAVNYKMEKEHSEWFLKCAEWVEKKFNKQLNNKKNNFFNKKKKIIIIGRGTAGSQAAAHVVKNMTDCEIEWHFDPNTSPQAVGEGSTTELPRNLYENLSFRHEDLKKIDGSFKTGIYKKNWGANGKEFTHGFIPPFSSYHFNAIGLQNYIFEKLKSKVKVLEINHENSKDLDADHILDCSGRPNSYEHHKISPYIPVNSVYVTQCYWDYAKFDYTLTIARPYGWIFGIPLQNRCSIGYLFNKNINSLEEIKEDVKNIFTEYNLTPSDTTNHFSFESYTRKQNFSDNISYSGNASFFLEPLEATSIGVMDRINRLSVSLWKNQIDLDQANKAYEDFVKETEAIIMLHYYSGSIFQTDFWKYAKELGSQCIREHFGNEKFKNIIQYCLSQENEWGNLTQDQRKSLHYATWGTPSFVQNIYGLDIFQRLSNLKDL
jgi:hypothetical protein